MPTEIDVVERRIRQLEIEKAALAKETDDVSKQRLASLEAEPGSVGALSRGAKYSGWAVSAPLVAVTTPVAALGPPYWSRAAWLYERAGDWPGPLAALLGLLPFARRTRRQAKG